MAGGERWVWLPEWLEQQELVLERLWEEGQEEAHLQLQRLLRGQELRWYWDINDWQIRRRGFALKVAYVDARCPAMVRHPARGGDAGARCEVTVAEHWVERFPELEQHLGIAGSRQPCLAEYKPPEGRKGEYAQDCYRTYPLAACAVLVIAGGEQGGALAKPGKPRNCDPSWPEGLPPWARGAGGAGAVSAAAPSQQLADGAGGAALPAEQSVPVSSYAKNGFGRLVAALEPSKEAKAEVSGITDHVYRALSQGRISSKWCPLNVMKGGSVAKGTHLAGSFDLDLDLIVPVQHNGNDWDTAFQECMSDFQALLTTDGWQVEGAMPLRHLRFTRPVPGGPGGTPLHLDLVPLPAHDFLAEETRDQKLGATLYKGILAPLLQYLDSSLAETASAAPASGAAGSGNSGNVICVDELRPMRLTSVEVDVVRAQHVNAKAAMRMFKAWVYSGSHGVRGAEHVPATVLEVAVMAACTDGELGRPPYAASGARGAAVTQAPQAYDLFLRALGLVERRLRSDSTEPLAAYVLYTPEQAKRCRPCWGNGRPPFTPIIPYPADPTYNMRRRSKFASWDELADAAGKLRAQLIEGAAGLSSDDE